jgi:hypothetical protein
VSVFRQESLDPKPVLRVLRLLARGPARIAQTAQAGSVLLESEESGRCVVRRNLLDLLVRHGLVRREDDEIFPTAPGLELAKGKTGRIGLNGAPHRNIVTAQIDIGGSSQTTTLNLAESPLKMLARRKDRSGRKFLDENHLLAGERLRSDFTRGSMSPKLGVNWDTATASASRHGASGGIGDFTDAAMAARIRVEKAIESVGPELSGILLDACCFLKGMETVETERGWPPRSAKIVLKTALSALARHYGYASHAASSRRSGKIVHWGDENYRPTLEGRRNAG